MKKSDVSGNLWEKPRGITRICSANLLNKGALTIWNCRCSSLAVCRGETKEFLRLKWRVRRLWKSPCTGVVLWALDSTRAVFGFMDFFSLKPNSSLCHAQTSMVRNLHVGPELQRAVTLQKSLLMCFIRTALTENEMCCHSSVFKEEATRVCSEKSLL